MPLTKNANRTKHQVRTEETQSKILDAAGALFSEQGFEKTQLEEVAARAGYTRGAIYAHYASKEDLFLALMEHRVLSKFVVMRQIVGEEPEFSKRLGIFKRWIAAQSGDHTWGILMMEFKLYALRRPESRAKLQHTFDLLFKSSGSDFIEMLVGANMDKTTRSAIERRLVIMGAIQSAVVLESNFRPKLLPKGQLQAILEELYEALFHDLER